jgi:dTDP-4-amino-4,6-dideoxygalactose transaminase
MPEKKITERYDSLLDFSRANTQWNYSYYPIIFDSEARLLEVQAMLNENNIFPRRYFYPSLNTVPFVKPSSMPVSERIASKVMCLPLYVGLEKENIELICNIINR